MKKGRRTRILLTCVALLATCALGFLVLTSTSNDLEDIAKVLPQRQRSAPVYSGHSGKTTGNGARATRGSRSRRVQDRNGSRKQAGRSPNAATETTHLQTATELLSRLSRRGFGSAGEFLSKNGDLLSPLEHHISHIRSPAVLVRLARQILAMDNPARAVCVLCLGRNKAPALQQLLQRTLHDFDDAPTVEALVRALALTPRVSEFDRGRAWFERRNRHTSVKDEFPPVPVWKVEGYLPIANLAPGSVARLQRIVPAMDVDAQVGILHALSRTRSRDLRRFYRSLVGSDETDASVKVLAFSSLSRITPEREVVYMLFDAADESLKMKMIQQANWRAEDASFLENEFYANEDFNYKKALLNSLGQTRGKASVQALSRLAERQWESHLGVLAIGKLARQDKERARELLFSQLLNPNWSIRIASVEAIIDQYKADAVAKARLTEMLRVERVSPVRASIEIALRAMSSK